MFLSDLFDFSSFFSSGGGDEHGAGFDRRNSPSSSEAEEEEEETAAAAERAPPPDNYGFTADAAAIAGVGRRIDARNVGIALNHQLVKTYKEELLGRGQWGRKARKTMAEKYWLSQEQRSLLEPPSLRGSKIFWAVRGQELKGIGRELLATHDSMRNGIKIELRMYEGLLSLHQRIKAWTPWEVEAGPGRRRFPRLPAIKEFGINPDEDQAAVEVVARMGRQEGGIDAMALLVVRHRKMASDHETRYEEAMEKLLEAQAMATLGKDFAHTMVTVAWDSLQQHAQTDLGLSASRRLLFDQVLTPKMRDRLKAEAADRDKRQMRDASNNLLAADLDKLVSEESRTTTRMNQVTS